MFTSLMSPRPKSPKISGDHSRFPADMSAVRILSILCSIVTLLPNCAPTIAPRDKVALDASIDGDHFIADDGMTMRFRTWLPEGPPHAILVAVHGMNEYSRAFEWPAEEWRNQQIGVYALDQRGFGDSEFRGLWPGADNLASDLDAFTRLVKSRHSDLPLYLLGESMGGGVVLLAAGRADSLPIDGIILVAPAVAPWEEFPLYWRAPLWLAAHTVPWFPMTGRGLKIQPTDNIEVWHEMSSDKLIIRETRVDAIYGVTQLMDKAAKTIPNNQVPTLLLYGCRDDFVRSWMVSWVIENANKRRIDVVTYDEGFHWLLRDFGAKAVLDDIFDWIGGVPNSGTLKASRGCR